MWFSIYEPPVKQLHGLADKLVGEGDNLTLLDGWMLRACHGWMDGWMDGFSHLPCCKQLLLTPGLKWSPLQKNNYSYNSALNGAHFKKVPFLDCKRNFLLQVKESMQSSRLWSAEGGVLLLAISQSPFLRVTKTTFNSSSFHLQGYRRKSSTKLILMGEMPELNLLL